MRTRPALLVIIWLLFTGPSWGADKDSALLTATGTVNKADKASLTVTPRGKDGKFERNITLRLTGTSNLSLLTTQKRGGKVVNVQRSVDAADLQAGQAVAVIYTRGSAGMVVLAAVVEPAGP